MVSAKCHDCKTGKRDGHGKPRNGHEKVMDFFGSSLWGTLALHLDKVSMQLWQNFEINSI